MKTSEAKINSSAVHFQKIANKPFFNTEDRESFFSKSGKPKQSFFKPATIQPKLTIGKPNDVYEKEADVMADKVVQRLNENKPDVKSKNGNTVQTKIETPLRNTITPLVQTKCAACEQEEKLQKKEEENERDLLKGKLQKKFIFESNAEPPDDDNKSVQRKCAECEKEDEKKLQRKCDECEKEDKLQKKPEASSQSASPNIESSLNASKGSGSQLPVATREQMEDSFGADFSSVRIHNDSSAVQMNKDLHAHAFTHGSNIYFNSGKYDTNSSGGKHLLAHELTHVVQQGSSDRVIHRKSKENPSRFSYPWIGQIDNTWSAALRKTAQKYSEKPHSNTLADLSKGTEVLVLSRSSAWLLVQVNIDGKTLQGYVSQELVTYIKPSSFTLPEITITVKIPTLSEAFVELKRAEKRKIKEGENFKPTDEEQNRIDSAIIAVNQTKKYVVDEKTYSVNFSHIAGVKTKIDTIEDFILFVEQIEKQYPSASPAEIVSEIRQLWFSDVNWELLVSSSGIQDSGKDIDIETEPNPIASQFDMKNLAPAAGSKQFDTRMGKIDIGHVMAGIDARLSGFPSAYPKSNLAKKGHDDSDSELKYKTLKTASAGNSSDFTTWAGDIGQAYAEYLVDRYVKKNTSATFTNFINTKAPPEEMLGDVHGYIAVEVYRAVPASISPTGREHKVSNILRDMYLVDKSATGDTYEKYFEKVSGKSGADLKPFITDRSLRFAGPWFAKKAVEHRGKWGSKGWTGESIIENALKEFNNKHLENEKAANLSDKLESAVDDLLKQLKKPIQ